MTQGTIKLSQKKLKESNQDCGGFEVGLEGFYPGLKRLFRSGFRTSGLTLKALSSSRMTPTLGST
jgi:hypothetical protein